MRHTTFALLLASACSALAAPALRVAVIDDGDGARARELVPGIEREFAAVADGSAQLEFVQEAALQAGHNPNRVSGLLAKAQGDARFNAVLLTGPMASLFAAYGDAPIAKPVLSVAALDRSLLPLPQDAAGRSTRAGFAFLAERDRVRRDLETFATLGDLTRLHVLVQQNLLASIPDLGAQIRSLAPPEVREVVVVVAVAGADADETLKALPADGAVYVAHLAGWPAGERAKLFAELAGRGVRTFAMTGDQDVGTGAFAGLNRALDARICRQAALNLFQLARGTSPNLLASELANADGLSIHALAARAVNFRPDFDTRVDAEFLDSESLDEGDALSLEEAMSIAADNSVEVSAQQAAVERQRELSGSARGSLLPQVRGSARFQQIDNDRSEASGGGVAERDTRAGLAASQILYDESAELRVQTAKRATRQTMFEEERTRLDAMQRAGSDYLRWMLSRSLCEIERGNLRLTRRHLALARDRVRLGAVGREEVYRWEAEEARQHGSVLQAEAAIEKARVALNRALNEDSGQTWTAKPVELPAGRYLFLDEARIGDWLGDEAVARPFREFAVLRALDAAPELKALDESIASQGLVVAQRRRSGYVPSVMAQASYDRIIAQDFAGSDFSSELARAGLPVSTSTTDDNEWLFGLAASVPLFEGGSRTHDVAAGRAQLDVLEQGRIVASQAVEQRVLNALYDLKAAYPAVALRRLAADRAERSLEVISDKYARGATQIIDLLEAQNQALRERIGAAAAANTYLQSLLEFQRAIAWFPAFQTAEAREAWVAHLRRYMDASVVPARPDEN